MELVCICFNDWTDDYYPHIPWVNNILKLGQDKKKLKEYVSKEDIAMAYTFWDMSTMYYITCTELYALKNFPEIFDNIKYKKFLGYKNLEGKYVSNYLEHRNIEIPFLPYEEKYIGKMKYFESEIQCFDPNNIIYEDD